MTRRFRNEPTPALQDMLLADQARGVDVLNDPPGPPRPPAYVEPLLPVTIPRPEWRREEIERAWREAAEQQAEPEAASPSRGWTPPGRCRRKSGP